MNIDPTGMLNTKPPTDAQRRNWVRTGSWTNSLDAQAGTIGAQTNPGTEPLTQKITPLSALEHYKEGTGAPLRMSFQDVDTSAVTPTYFDAFNKKLAGASPGSEIKIDAKQPFSTGGAEAAYLGNITLRMQGVLSVGEKGSWTFKGSLKSYDDIYDANKSTHRSAIAEWSTTVLSKIPGKPYDIQIRGEKPVVAVGQPRDPMNFPRFGLFTY